MILCGGRKPGAVVDVAVVKEEDIAVLGPGSIPQQLQGRDNVPKGSIKVRLMPAALNPGMQVRRNEHVYFAQTKARRRFRADCSEVIAAVIEAPARGFTPTGAVMATAANAFTAALGQCYCQTLKKHHPSCHAGTA